ncbi:MAG: glycosyltransferase [Myxococcales bacterium]|nr:glycosyltransferase [Polyangiaceae bacterium]MDW8248334.1 glycosyltransferase [Myxococcales bacterium]
MSSPNAPCISILIPVYNEEPLLRAAAVDLRERLAPLGWSYEVILAENGSRDGTVAEARALCARYPEFRTFSVGEPNYGRALRQAILQARGELVICEEIDLCDTNFHQAAVALLTAGEADLVIGSKLLSGSSDERPLARHLASRFYNGLLRATLSFRGTDTHGLKAFRRAALLPIVHRCTVEGDVFASELVIRADRAGIRMQEIPVRVLEKRPPTINLARRVPTVLWQLARLTWAIRVRGP